MAFRASGVNGATAPLALRGDSYSWKSQKSNGVKRFNECVEKYNSDIARQPIGSHQPLLQRFEVASVEFWSRDVCLVFANHLALNSVKSRPDDNEDADPVSLAVDTVVQ